jgi:hypothetical protein
LGREGELQDLADDIAAHGLRHPIVIDATGEILIDGRNRLRACEMAGVEPVFVRLNGEDPAACIVSANVERRSLTVGQKAIARALASPEAKRGGDRRSERFQVGNSNLDRAAVSQARLIIRVLGEPIALAILAGAKPFDEALKEATAARDRQASDARADGAFAR